MLSVSRPDSVSVKTKTQRCLFKLRHELSRELVVSCLPNRTWKIHQIPQNVKKNISYLFLAQGCSARESLMFGPKGYRVLSQTPLASLPLRYNTHHWQGYLLSPSAAARENPALEDLFGRSAEDRAAEPSRLKLFSVKLLRWWQGQLRAKTQHTDATIKVNLLGLW